MMKMVNCNYYYSNNLIDNYYLNTIALYKNYVKFEHFA